MKRAARKSPITDRLVALGDVVRLRALRLLEREELSVGEVARVVQLPQSTVSRHLKVLCDAGWLLKRTEGTATLYRIILDDLDAPARAIWVAVRDQMGSGSEHAEDLRRLSAVLADRREDSQAFFGRVAGQWDDVRSDLFGTRFTMRALLSLIPSNWTVADLGCGTGNIAELLAPSVARVIAIDQSAPMLKAAQKRLGEFSNVDFIRADLGAIPLSDAAVDAVVCALVLHHLADPAAALREARRILKPRGVLLLIDMVEHDRATYRHTMGHRWLGFSEPVMSQWLAAAGFADIRRLQLPPEPDAAGPGLFACTAFANARPATGR